MGDILLSIGLASLAGTLIPGQMFQQYMCPILWEFH